LAQALVGLVLQRHSLEKLMSLSSTATTFKLSCHFSIRLQLLALQQTTLFTLCAAHFATLV
jgi:hypothetical protein